LVSTSAAPVPAAEVGSFDCVIYPSLVAKLGSPAVGLLKSVLVDRGEHVEAGQVVARLESDVEEASVAFMRARAGSTAEIDARKANLELRRKQLDRSTRLLDRKVVAAQQVDELAAEAEIAEKELARAQLDRSLARLELARAEALLAQREIKAPFDGVVTERMLSAGEFVHQEAQILTLARLDPLHVEAFLPVEHYGRFELGAIAEVRPQDPVGGAYSAEVMVVDRVFDPASATIGVRLELANPEKKLPGGLRCTLSLPQVPPTLE